MSKIFVSHARDDLPLVEPFVSTILQLGCEVPQDEIFFSSRRATGVPSGSDLSAFVRGEAEGAGLVIAIITPTFQTRPYCIAELGAAWGVTGKLFPILLPGMPRTDLEGVLPSTLTSHLDDSAVLDELHDRVCDAAGTSPKAMTWSQRKAEWLAGVEAYAKKLKTPQVISAKDFERAVADAEGAGAALAACTQERERLEQLVARLAELKDREAVIDILIPEDESAAFDQLRSNLQDALRGLPPVVRDAIWYELAYGSMPFAEPFDDDRRREIDQALEQGFLVESSSELLVPSDDVVAVQTAAELVADLDGFLREASEEFDSWFRNEYGVAPILTKKMVWDALLGTRSW